jgi:hypothetical protein
VPDRGTKSCLGPGKDAQGLPADGMGFPAGTGLVTDTGHGLTGSKIYPVHYKSIVWEQNFPYFTGSQFYKIGSPTPFAIPALVVAGGL